MPRHLDPCPTCARHICADETLCPMCGGALASGWARERVSGPPAGSGRAVRFAWRLLLATSAGACGARTDIAHEDLGFDSGMHPIYGAPPADAGRDSGSVSDAGRDAGSVRDAGLAEDAGDDAGTDAGDMPIYGAPPPDELPTSHPVVVPPDPIGRRRRTPNSSR